MCAPSWRMRSRGGHAGPPLHAHEHAFRIRSIGAYINARNRIEFVHGNFFLLLSPQRAKIYDTAAHSAHASVRIRLTMLAFTGGQSCRGHYSIRSILFSKIRIRQLFDSCLCWSQFC